MKLKIFLDVDDTLNEFKAYSIQRGYDPGQSWAGQYWLEHPSTWTKEQKELDKLMVDLMEGDDFWPNIPVKEGALALILAAEEIGDTYLLTALPANCNNIDNIRKQKIEYCHNVLDFPLDHISVCARKDKVEYCGGAHTILIDDAKKNCDEWREAGGIAIQFKNDIDDTIKQLKELTQALIDY